MVLPNFPQVPVTLVFYQTKHLHKVRKKSILLIPDKSDRSFNLKNLKGKQGEKENLFFAKIKVRHYHSVYLFRYCPRMHISMTEDFLLYHTNPTFNPLRKLNIFHSSAMSVAKLTSVSKTITCGKKMT